MATRICPSCGDSLDDGGRCASCRYGHAKGASDGALSDYGIMARETAQHFRRPENQPSSRGLTDQQWYNVCKFWPKVSARCARPLVQVGHGQELELTASRGPLLGGRAPTPARDREPGEEG